MTRSLRRHPQPTLTCERDRGENVRRRLGGHHGGWSLVHREIPGPAGTLELPVGYVTARYICQGGEGAHVWVSVKQAESRRPESRLTKEGSGAASAAWSHSHANAAICDGAWHVQTLRVDQREWGWGTLEPGQAWVQFCVIPPGGDPEKGEITWSSRFASIK